ncbi:hypothetical protein ACV0BM_009820 [Elizabethkingia meningoseptica]
MRYFKYLFLLSFLFLVSCKKDKVDGESLKSFQSSVNDMASSLTTIKQIKFNEALYIIKKFGTNVEGDIEQMNATAKLLNGKNVPEILALADAIAQKQGIEWSSTAPPSLGEMNIFADSKPTEIDPNDIQAAGINIAVQPANVDSISGPKALMIVPRLVDAQGNKIEFSNAALETVLEVSSGGSKISTSKNLMVNNNFKGFYLKLSSLPVDRIMDNSIDIKVSVKTAKKVLQMTKTGISLNPNALSKPVTTEPTDPTAVNPDGTITNPDGTTTPANPDGTTTPPTPVEAPKALGDPKTSVSKFIGNIGSKNLKAAYEMSNNPSWGSYDSFSNSNSGFGAVKSISVKSVSTASKTADQATVNANYTVTDNGGKNTDLSVTYTLKASADGWKITGYKINSAK